MRIWQFWTIYMVCLLAGAYLLVQWVPAEGLGILIYSLYGTFAVALARPIGRIFGIDDVFEKPRTKP